MSEGIKIDFNPEVTDIAERLYNLEKISNYFQDRADNFKHTAFGLSQDQIAEEENKMKQIVENVDKEIEFNRKLLNDIWERSKQDMEYEESIGLIND